MSVEEAVNPETRGERSTRLRAVGEVLEHHAGTAMIVGGLLWVATYVVEVLIGVTLGEATYADPDLSSSWLVWFWPATFMGAIFFLATGLLGVAAHIGRGARILSTLGGLLAGVALVASAINLVRLTGAFGEVTASDGLGFLGVVGVLGGSIVLGSAAIRAKRLRPAARLAMALLPVAFVPAIIVTIPLEGVAPDYVVADLPFPVVGLLLASVGLMVRRDRDEQPAARV